MTYQAKYPGSSFVHWYTFVSDSLVTRITRGVWKRVDAIELKLQDIHTPEDLQCQLERKGYEIRSM